MTDLQWGRAVCYSGYRENQSPKDCTYPTYEQTKEDLEIIVKEGFQYIRMYDPVAYAKTVCEVIRQNNMPLKLMLGPGLISEVNNKKCPWNKTFYTKEQLEERARFNDSRIEELIKITNDYRDVVFAVSVGNENTPEWGENMVPVERLITFAKKLKKGTDKPVTFNEGAKEWTKLEQLAEYMDIISVHSYPLWYGNTVDEAIDANKKDYEMIRKLYPDKPILFSEVGWATRCLANTDMKIEEANEEKQVQYYREFWEWTDAEKIIAFMFEAFDEPWKGGKNPDEAEKHWGMFHVDRTPKKVMA